jgi:hypothetical protein
MGLHRLRVFENWMLRDDMVGGWRKFHSDKLRNLCSSPNTMRIITSRRIMWAGHVASMGKRRDAYRDLAGELEGKRAAGRPGSVKKVTLFP